MHERNQTIDSIRAVAVLVMILTHSLVPYLTHQGIYRFWDIIHFAVPAFVFCSGYVFYSTVDTKPHISYLKYIQKRFYRLVIPYYVYALAFIIFAYLTGTVTITPLYLIQVVTFTGGIDLSWLVLLFFFFSLLTPVFYHIHKNRLVRWTYIPIVALCTAVLLFVTPSISYKWYMWLPWSLPFLYSYIFIHHAHRKRYLWWTIPILLLLFCLSIGIRAHMHKSINLFGNKYPPTILYLSYGLLWIHGMYTIIQKLTFSQSITSFITFVSRYSYSLFFIHYFLIIVASHFLIPKILPWYIFTILITASSVIIQWTLAWLNRQWVAKRKK